MAPIVCTTHLVVLTNNGWEILRKMIDRMRLCAPTGRGQGHVCISFLKLTTIMNAPPSSSSEDFIKCSFYRGPKPVQKAVCMDLSGPLGTKYWWIL